MSSVGKISKRQLHRKSEIQNEIMVCFMTIEVSNVTKFMVPSLFRSKNRD